MFTWAKYLIFSLRSLIRFFSKSLAGIDSTTDDICMFGPVAGTCWFGGGGAMSICNPVLQRTILRKSITFAYVHLRGNKSKLGLKEA